MKLADALAAGETRLVDRTNLKLGEVIEKYLSYQQLNDRAPKTMEKYEYVLKRLLGPWWTRQGDKPAASFKTTSRSRRSSRTTACHRRPFPIG